MLILVPIALFILSRAGGAFNSRVKATPAIRREKGYGDENGSCFGKEWKKKPVKTTSFRWEKEMFYWRWESINPNDVVQWQKLQNKKNYYKPRFQSLQLPITIFSTFSTLNKITQFWLVERSTINPKLYSVGVPINFPWKRRVRTIISGKLQRLCYDQ